MLLFRIIQFDLYHLTMHVPFVLQRIIISMPAKEANSINEDEIIFDKNIDKHLNKIKNKVFFVCSHNNFIGKWFCIEK